MSTDTRPVRVDSDGNPESFYCPAAKYHVPLRRRLQWARRALQGHVSWIVWNYRNPETGEPLSLTVAGFEVPRDDPPAPTEQR